MHPLAKAESKEYAGALRSLLRYLLDAKDKCFDAGFDSEVTTLFFCV